MLDFFEPSPDIIGALQPKKVTNSGKSSFLIPGDNFQTGGATKVLIGATEIPAANINVVDRNTIRVRVPKKFPTGSYVVTVTNPDGESDATGAGALKVVRP